VGDARYGRRDNGLVASEYAPVGDVDPRVGEHLLDVLALEGIAAYLRPSSDLHPVTRSTLLPKLPTDRLYVDRAHVGTARAYVARLAREERESEARAAEAWAAEQTRAARTVEARADASPGDDEAPPARPAPEPTTEEVDRAFAQIVAGWGRTATAPPLPRVEELRTDAVETPDQPPAEPSPSPYGRPVQPLAEQPSLLDGLDTFGADLADEQEDEEFVPPEAPPVPRPSLPAALGVIGMVGGLAVFLKPDLLPFLTERLAMFLGFAAVVSGFGTLIWRLRPGDDDDPADSGDDGARV
jgi:hypothetical protein